MGWGPGDFSKVGQIGEGNDGRPPRLPPEGPAQCWTTEPQTAPDSESGRPWHLAEEGLWAGSFSLEAVGRASKGGLIPCLRIGRAVDEGELLVTLCQALG